MKTEGCIVSDIVSVPVSIYFTTKILTQPLIHRFFKECTLQCRQGSNYVHLNSSGLCIKTFTMMKPWTNASIICREKRLRLVSLDTQNKIDRLNSHLENLLHSEMGFHVILHGFMVSVTELTSCVICFQYCVYYIQSCQNLESLGTWFISETNFWERYERILYQDWTGFIVYFAETLYFRTWTLGVATNILIRLLKGENRRVHCKWHCKCSSFYLFHHQDFDTTPHPPFL